MHGEPFGLRRGANLQVPCKGLQSRPLHEEAALLIAYLLSGGTINCTSFGIYKTDKPNGCNIMEDHEARASGMPPTLDVMHIGFDVKANYSGHTS